MIWRNRFIENRIFTHCSFEGKTEKSLFYKGFVMGLV